MPTYEFRCPQGHEFEKFYRTISGAESSAACPLCGQAGERMMSATGFAFKGSGFYLTDYGKNAHRDKGTPTPASSASGDAGAKGDNAKGDSPKGDGGGKESSKGDTANSSSGSGSGSGSGSSSGGDGAKPAPAESKAPAAPAPKKGTGE